MRKNYHSLLYAILIVGIISLVFVTMMPRNYSKNKSLSEFSTERALEHVKIIAEQPHYLGSSHHASVLGYLKEELEKLGLETQIQRETILSKWNNLAETQNLIARIKGSDNSKALVLLTHYDSAPHSKSFGASDDANGLATILEGLRVFIHNKTAHKNDIIILFTDGEELGLNGAYAFASQHPWAKDVGLVINFEARGSSGPSMMLAETNSGNANLIKGFAQASPRFPVSNSLMYSIYKMLPNDTDMTAFREKAKVPGFNFAYIDDHFDYHTVQDNYENFTPECLEHQATYLMPLLQHFSNTDITEMESQEDEVYFSVPFGFIHYPFSWNLPILLGTILLFFITTFIGLGKGVLDGKEIVKGFVPLFLSLVVCGAIGYLGWKLLLELYPVYQDMLHGFTYNGHTYMVAFLLLSVALCFFFYAKWTQTKYHNSLVIAPLFLWLLLCAVLYIYLPGAVFFVLPAFFVLLGVLITVILKKDIPLLQLVFSVPALVLIVPFIALFPVGLGLKILFGSMLLTVFVFTMLLPLLAKFEKPNNWGILLLLVSVAFFVKSHFESDFERGKGKPNSLLYVFNADTDQAHWATYDKVLDSWTKSYLGENPKSGAILNQNMVRSKYNSGFSYSAEAPKKKLAAPIITFIKDTIVGDLRQLVIEIDANKKVNRMDIFAHPNLKIYNLFANGVKNIRQEGSLFQRKESQVLNYYPIDARPLRLSFQIQKGAPLDMEVMISSFDLLENELFSIPNRPEDKIPMPFVLNDAIVVKKKLKKELVITRSMDSLPAAILTAKPTRNLDSLGNP
jgi:hypothetical protein